MDAMLGQEQFWLDKIRYDNAERLYYEYLCKDLNKKNVLNVKNDAGVVELVNSNEKLPNNCEQAIRSLGIQHVSETNSKKTKKLKKCEIGISGVHEVTAATESNPQTPPKNTAVSVEVKSTVKKSKKKNKNAATKKGQDEASKNVQEEVKPISVNYKHGKAQNKTNLSLNVNEHVSTNNKGSPLNNQCTLVSEIAKAREHIKNSLEKMDGIATLAATPVSNELIDRVANVEKENDDLKELVQNLRNLCLNYKKRIEALEYEVFH